MNVSPLMLRHQVPTIKTFGKVIASMVLPGDPPSQAPSTPGEKFTETVAPRDNEMIDQFIAWSGAPADRYTNTVPPHLFPQWGFPIMSKTLAGVPFEIAKVLNQGARIEINAPIPRNVPLTLSAWLHNFEDDGYKARIHQRLVTGTDQHPEALISDVFAVVVHKKNPNKSPRDNQKEPKWNTIGAFDSPIHDGRNFAFLTGDLNPIHWVGPYAKMAGFKRPILHGFGSYTKAFEAVQSAYPGYDLHGYEVRFVKPLVLPNTCQIQATKPAFGKLKVRIIDQKQNVCMVGEIELKKNA